MASRSGSAGGGEGVAVSDAPARETVLGNCVRCGSSDKLKFCSRCQAVRYCSSECQKDDVSVRVVVYKFL